jgi:glycerol-3-phosphate dehydrogenase (NAD(P)+)
MKITVIGSGAMGSALANVLADNGEEVLVYGVDKEQLEDMAKRHKNTAIFGDLVLNKSILTSDSLSFSIKWADAILFAVPSKFIASVARDVDKNLHERKLIINATKGLSEEGDKTIQEVIYSSISEEKIEGVVSLLGPGFAKEIVEKNLTCICAVSKSKTLATEVQKIFSNDYFRVYVLTDVIGAEIASSMKNAIAIASGIITGLGYSENTRAALITRGLNEMVKFGIALGAKEETFYGLTGVGDLVLTCSSMESRNFSLGYEIGKNDLFSKSMFGEKKTIEGVNAIEVIHDLSKELKLDLPIIESLYKVLFMDEKPSKMAIKLMKRPLKEEKQ